MDILIAEALFVVCEHVLALLRHRLLRVHLESNILECVKKHRRVG